MTRELVIRTAEADEMAAVAQIHFESLPNDFLPSLGLTFLKSAYYPAASASPFAANLVAVEAKRVVGFVTIAHDSGRFSHDILRREWPRIMWYALRAAARDPRHVFLSAQVLSSVLLSRPDPVKGEIVLIAVDVQCRGKGIGKELVRASLAHLARHNVDTCRTKTLADNAGVIRMYEQIGWHVRNHFHLIGRDYVTIVSPPFDISIQGR